MKTDWLRTSLIAGIVIVGFLLIIRWNEFQERHQTPPQEVTREEVPTNNLPVPSDPIPDAAPQEHVPQARSQETVTAPSIDAPSTPQVRIRTDVLDVTVDTHGGDIVGVALPSFYANIDTPELPYVLLTQGSHRTYIARSGLIGTHGTDSAQSRPTFTVEQSEYQLSPSQNTLAVDLHYQQTDDVRIIKRFAFERGSHLINISYIVDNQSSEPWQAVPYGQIQRDDYNPGKAPGMFAMQPFLGAATSTLDTNYLKLDFGDLADEPFKHERPNGWVAMVQHYFLSAWIPQEGQVNQFELFKSQSSDTYFLQFTGAETAVAPGGVGELTMDFYAGPKHIRTLEEISPYLDLTVDYSFLWWIAKPLFFALEAIHGLVGNWGLAIMLLTLGIKIMFFYPSAASYRSMAKMRKLQPKLKELKERYGEDKQKFSSEMMKLYRTEKVNPLGGCLPILIQMPVFIALYWVLMESVELRHAPFILWIQDLSVRDPFYVLPLIMGASMWFQMKLNPPPADPMQAKVMQLMPIFFTFIFLFFPAGLVLYWVVNNLLGIAQQYYITKQVEKQ